MQKVYLSETKSGQPGLFTNRMLVMSVTASEYARLKADPKAFADYCRARNFEPEVQ